MDSERRQFFQAVAAGASILVAGCVGGAGDDSGAGNGNGNGGDDGDDGGGANGGGNANIDASNGEFTYFEFEAGERYEYDVFMEEDGEGSFVWDVQDVSENQMTINTVYDVGETYYESTITGDKDTIQGQVMMSPAGGFMAAVLFAPTWSYYQQGNLEVGNRWEVSGPEGSIVLETVGQEAYAGVECLSTELRRDGEVTSESCVNAQLGLAPYLAFYNDSGDLEVEMELTSYSPPE